MSAYKCKYMKPLRQDMSLVTSSTKQRMIVVPIELLYSSYWVTGNRRYNTTVQWPLSEKWQWPVHCTITTQWQYVQTGSDEGNIKVLHFCGTIQIMSDYMKNCNTTF